MTHTPEIEFRKNQALNAIKRVFGTEADEYGATLFAHHNLEELPSDFWQRHLGRSRPEPVRVLGLLELGSSWGSM